MDLETIETTAEVVVESLWRGKPEDEEELELLELLKELLISFGSICRWPSLFFWNEFPLLHFRFFVDALSEFSFKLAEFEMEKWVRINGSQRPPLSIRKRWKRLLDLYSSCFSLNLFLVDSEKFLKVWAGEKKPSPN